MAKHLACPDARIKYNEEYVINELKELLSELHKDEDIITLNELTEFKPYCNDTYNNWKDKYSSNSQITESIKKIKDILEKRIVKGATTKGYNPTFSIFNLKNNYGWKDKYEHDGTNDTTLIIKVEDDSDSEI